LISAVTPGIVFNDLYAGYTARVSGLIELLESENEDLDDYVEDIKTILEIHSSKSTTRFLAQFYEVYGAEGFFKRDLKRARGAARSWLNGLINPINDAILLIEERMRARRALGHLDVNLNQLDQDNE
jgi:hypothetical protein